MNAVEAALRRISADLDRRRQKWALVGGFAVSARAEPRFTRDVAVAVADDQEAELLEILPGLTVPVARIGHLIALKLLARDDDTRPQDAADLRALVEVGSASDLELSHRMVELITTRGFHRGRDLKKDLARLA